MIIRESDEDILALRWQEYGGPPVNLPTRRGFGSRLMAGLANDLGGNGELTFAPDGVVWTLRSHLKAITG
jgi:two-component sensor histidine kinase